MYHSPLDYLKHIRDEINFITTSCNNLSDDSFYRDEVLKRAVVRSFEIIGEAIKQIKDDIKNKYPDVNWKDIARMRDKLIHHYSGVDYTMVWEIINTDVPELKNQIEQIIKELTTKI